MLKNTYFHTYTVVLCQSFGSQKSHNQQR